MKEQDAAHSFTEGSEVPENKSIIQFLLGANSYDGYWWNDSPQIHGRAPFWWRKKLREEFESKDAELTRLRSELQQERDKARNQAIQDCIDIVSVTPGDENVIPKLEQLKTKP